jgi:hypothetical protein
MGLGAKQSEGSLRNGFFGKMFRNTPPPHVPMELAFQVQRLPPTDARAGVACTCKFTLRLGMIATTTRQRSLPTILRTGLFGDHGPLRRHKHLGVLGGRSWRGSSSGVACARSNHLLRDYSAPRSPAESEECSDDCGAGNTNRLRLNRVMPVLCAAVGGRANAAFSTPVPSHKLP